MILLPPGMALDLGGIAKGWIAEQAALILSDFSSACAVNAGGDMFLIGFPDGEDHWSVALEDPLQPEIHLTTLKVDPGAVATSSVTKRTWKQGEKQRHHLIDPRTGEPAVTDWLSMTVIAAHAYEAEVFAKALLIGGPKECEDIARMPVGSNYPTWLWIVIVKSGALKKVWSMYMSIERQKQPRPTTIFFAVESHHEHISHSPGDRIPIRWRDLCTDPNRADRREMDNLVLWFG